MTCSGADLAGQWRPLAAALKRAANPVYLLAGRPRRRSEHRQPDRHRRLAGHRTDEPPLPGTRILTWAGNAALPAS
jgi:hypothetical protein